MNETLMCSRWLAAMHASPLVAACNTKGIKVDEHEA